MPVRIRFWIIERLHYTNSFLISKVLLRSDTFVILSGCTDRYPKNYKCGKNYTCAKLAAKKQCSKRWKQVMPKFCKNKVSKAEQNKVIKTYCKKSCGLTCCKLAFNVSVVQILIFIT